MISILVNWARLDAKQREITERRRSKDDYNQLRYVTSLLPESLVPQWNTVEGFHKGGVAVPLFPS
jgi:hypothetical protein